MQPWAFLCEFLPFKLTNLHDFFYLGCFQMPEEGEGEEGEQEIKTEEEEIFKVKLDPRFRLSCEQAALTSQSTP